MVRESSACLQIAMPTFLESPEPMRSWGVLQTWADDVQCLSAQHRGARGLDEADHMAEIASTSTQPLAFATVASQVCCRLQRREAVTLPLSQYHLSSRWQQGLFIPVSVALSLMLVNLLVSFEAMLCCRVLLPSPVHLIHVCSERLANNVLAINY